MVPISGRKIVSVLLASTCLLWSSGCYMTTQITPSHKYEGKEITVSTKDGRTVHLMSWRVLENGDIEGKGKERVGTSKKVLKFEGIIPAAQIESVTYEELHIERSILWGACLVGIVSLGFLIHPRLPRCGF